MHSTLHIKQLSLSVNLGWHNKERDSAQSVFLDMIIRFQIPPKACVNDNLNDTQCYATLISHIRQTTDTKHYKLVEHLTADIYQITLSVLPPHTSLQISITKFPQIGGLNGGVTFHYGDF